MRAILQRVSSAAVEVEGEIVGEIAQGILALVGVARGDSVADASALADKLVGLRIFEDPVGKMNLSLPQIEGSVLVVSQFTLAASLVKGRRPSFNDAALPVVAEPLIDTLMQRLSTRVPVEGGRFGAHMNVSLVNDGPVTFVLDVRDGKVL